MAQATSPDYDQLQEDPSLSENSTEGKTSLLGKLKEKKNKLKSKLKHNKTSEDSKDSSSSDEEEDAPVHNAVEGVTQPAYGQKASEDKPKEVTEESKPEPPTNFPGDFTGILNNQPGAEDNADDSGLSKSFQGLTTNDSPSESTGTEVPAESKSEEPLSAKGTDTEQQYTSSDAPAGLEQAGDKTTDAGKSWSQWAAEKVGYAKDSAAADAPTTAEGKPIHEEAYGTAVGAKDNAADKAAGAKDSLAAQVPSDPAQQTYVQKATSGIYGAKDRLFTSTEPGEHDKALSQKVTESVGNLPGTIKSSLGFGGGASSPTTTSVSTDGHNEEAAGAPPQSPGLVSRITGLFSPKTAATEHSTPSSEPASSETGSETATEVSEQANLS